MRSRRGALRFSGNGHKVHYKTAYEDGEANLLNISTTGCALEQLSLLLTLQEKVLVSISLSDEDTIFQARGTVIRTEEGLAAVHFSIVESDDLDRLRIYFLNRKRKSRK